MGSTYSGSGKIIDENGAEHRLIECQYTVAGQQIESGPGQQGWFGSFQARPRHTFKDNRNTLTLVLSDGRRGRIQITRMNGSYGTFRGAGPPPA
jgi:hypothetical protein